MEVLVPRINGHIHNQLTRSLERILEEANLSGELKLSNRKLKDFPKNNEKYNLSDTVTADLSKNRFTELPEEIATFHFLEKLHCYHNSIRCIPETVSSLKCLNFLDLSRNQLTNLPREICQLPIQILLVSNNRLTCLPDELSRMSHLTELDASCNQLTHLPPRLGDLKSLQSLVLRSNLLLAVPIEITNLKLIRLDLRSNRINILPIELREMTTLIDLLVEDNPLTSPPASLCKRGRVHIFKYLEIEAIKLDKKNGVSNTGTLSRRSRRSGTGSSPGPPHLADRLKHKRQNVDSGYSTSSDCYEKRWSTEVPTEEKSWQVSPTSTRSATTRNGSISTSSTISPGPEQLAEDEKEHSPKFSFSEEKVHKDPVSVRVSPNSTDNLFTNGNGIESKPYNQQTYREYKEALKLQRAQDVPSIYRTKDSDDQTYNKTEPNTPTHSCISPKHLSTSKSDPNPLNSVFGSPKHVFDDTNPKKPVQKVTPSRQPVFTTTNGCLNGNSIDQNPKNGSPNKNIIPVYVKPNSPLKTTSVGVLSHDNVPNCNVNGKNAGTRSPGSYMNGQNSSLKGGNGVKTNRNISWSKESDKMTFTMRREIDKAREETDLINQLRNIIESRLKMVLPQDLAPSLTDGVVLCHLANLIKPRSVASIHVPSPAVPKLSMARCRRNVDNFIDACRKIGVDEGLLCTSLDVTEALDGRGLLRLLDTLECLIEFEEGRNKPKLSPIMPKMSPLVPKMSLETPTKPSLQDTAVSLLLLTMFFTTVVLLYAFPPPN